MKIILTGATGMIGEGFYKYLAWMMPVLKSLFPAITNTMKQVAEAMIQVSEKGYPRNVIYVKDIHQLNAGKLTQ